MDGSGVWVYNQSNPHRNKDIHTCTIESIRGPIPAIPSLFPYLDQLPHRQHLRGGRAGGRHEEEAVVVHVHLLFWVVILGGLGRVCGGCRCGGGGACYFLIIDVVGVRCYRAPLHSTPAPTQPFPLTYTNLPEHRRRGQLQVRDSVASQAVRAQEGAPVDALRQPLPLLLAGSL